MKTLTLVGEAIMKKEFGRVEAQIDLPLSDELARALDVGGGPPDMEMPVVDPAVRAARTPSQPTDPYKQYADGVLAYANTLHDEQRDHALVRLRTNSSLALHILGFHEHRVRLGTLALEAAQYVDDDLTVIAILIDDLGWANYLLREDVAVRNIRKGIEYAEGLPTGTAEPLRTLLHAKALRHLGVVRTDLEHSIMTEHFNEARSLLSPIAPESRDAAIDLAHVDYAQGLATATNLGLNMAGVFDPDLKQEHQLLDSGLELVRRARQAFHDLEDHGRYAKSLVLEARLLEALGKDTEAQQIAALRDRAIAASVWARPAGRASITGR